MCEGRWGKSGKGKREEENDGGEYGKGKSDGDVWREGVDYVRERKKEVVERERRENDKKGQ